MKKSIKGNTMKLGVEPKSVQFRKVPFVIFHHRYRNEESGKTVTNDKCDEIDEIQLLNQYRERFGIPFPEEIQNIRKMYGVSAAKMSEILGFGANSYRKYEAGEMPSVANGRLILAVKHPKNFIEQVEACSGFISEKEKNDLIRVANEVVKKHKKHQFENFRYSLIYGNPETNEFTGYKKPCKKKIAAIIGYFGESTNLFKTKLNKLLFYADFGHYQKYGKSITGLKYSAIDYGPVPNGYDEIYGNLVKEGKIYKKYTESVDGFFGEKFYGLESLSDELFTPEEIETLTKVIQKFKDKSSKEMVTLSHDEEAWIDNEKGKEIISYQRYAFNLQHFKNNAD